jgi:hypothetical protein
MQGTRIRIEPKILPQPLYIALSAVATVYIGMVYLFMVHLTTWWAAQTTQCRMLEWRETGISKDAERRVCGPLQDIIQGSASEEPRENHYKPLSGEPVFPSEVLTVRQNRPRSAHHNKFRFHSSFSHLAASRLSVSKQSRRTNPNNKNGSISPYSSLLRYDTVKFPWEWRQYLFPKF